MNSNNDNPVTVVLVMADYQELGLTIQELAEMIHQRSPASQVVLMTHDDPSSANGAAGLLNGSAQETLTLSQLSKLIELFAANN
jgi:hypothetical protein